MRQTLKTETMKYQQFRGEYLQLKNELNDLRDWRENYLKQQKLQQTQHMNTNSEEQDSHSVHDNASSTSEVSNHTASSNNSRNSITIKNKLKIMKHKSVTAIKNVELPSFTDLLSNEFTAVDDEKVAHDAVNINNNSGNVSAMVYFVIVSYFASYNQGKYT